MIFERIYVQATHMAGMSRTRGDNYKQQPHPLSYRGDKCLQEAIPWGFHPYQETVGTNVQILDLVHLLASLEP